MDTATARPTVFVSYSHQDEAWKDRLVKQLRVLEREGDLEVWADRRIDAGDDWLPEIELYKLSREEAVRFLLQRTEEGRAKATDDDRQATALAEVLDGLPLALEQAAAFILRRRMRLADQPKRAVDIFERSVESDHPWTQTGRRNLATLLAQIAAAPGGDDDLTTSEVSVKRPTRRRRSQGARDRDGCG